MSNLKQFIESPKGRVILKLTTKVVGFAGGIAVARAIVAPKKQIPVFNVMVTSNHATTAPPVTDTPLPGAGVSVESIKATAAKKAGAKRPQAKTAHTK